MNWLLSSRRQFLASGSGAFALTLLAGSIRASAHAFPPQFAARPTLVLYRGNEACSRSFAEEFAVAGLMLSELGNDPVRQWRDELGKLVMNDKVVLTGLGNWADFSILRGLAAEHRRFPRMLIRHDKCQPARADWARDHARELLTGGFLNTGEQPGLFAQNLNIESTINTGQPSLFSWII